MTLFAALRQGQLLFGEWELSEKGNLKHSVANTADDADDARMFAPAAARNGDAIVAALAPLLPKKGKALEVASGTGEHVVKLATATPGLTWYPTDIDTDRLTSIAAWTTHEKRTNIEAPVAFNAVTQVWDKAEMDAIYLANLLHLISSEAAMALIANLASICAPTGHIAIYGPFKRGGTFASEGDEAFDTSLRLRDPAIGYKSIEWVDQQFAGHDLRPTERIAMPANNILTLWSRTAS